VHLVGLPSIFLLVQVWEPGKFSVIYTLVKLPVQGAEIPECTTQIPGLVSRGDDLDQESPFHEIFSIVVIIFLVFIIN